MAERMGPIVKQKKQSAARCVVKGMVGNLRRSEAPGGARVEFMVVD